MSGHRNTPNPYRRMAALRAFSVEREGRERVGDQGIVEKVNVSGDRNQLNCARIFGLEPCRYALTKRWNAYGERPWELNGMKVRRRSRTKVKGTPCGAHPKFRTNRTSR